MQLIQLNHRTIAGFSISPIGLGCMSLNHAYGIPPSVAEAEALLLKALDLGVNFFDTAALYGFGANEELVGRVLSAHRHKFILASKCGMTGVDGKRVIDGRPETIKRTCEESLRRLRTDVIDVYYLHRRDKQVPIEDSVGALADLVRDGKIRGIGLSEVSAPTLRRAHAVHPICALQNEYSLWTRNPEIATLQTCRELGVAFVAFSPVARGFLSGQLRDTSALVDKDIRSGMPRFQTEHFPANLRLLDAYVAIAKQAGCTPAQLALAWVLSRGDHVIAIPGTTRLDHLVENVGAQQVVLGEDVLVQLEELINRHTVSGGRYNAATQAEIDTENF